MGLAASQGRFLLLTSRQSDVEMRMQTITNQKLALMRQQSALSAQHANAMNAKNVMWQPSTDAEAAELQYQYIMQEQSPYVLTNAYGAVMLDGSSQVSKKIAAALGIDPSDYPQGISAGQFVELAGSKEDFLKNFVTGSVGSTTGGANANSAEAKIAALLNDEKLVSNNSTGAGNSLFETSYNDALIKQIAFADNGGVAGKYTVNDGEKGSETSGQSFGGRDVLLIPMISKDWSGKDSGFLSESEARDSLNNNTKSVQTTIKNASNNIKAITNNLTEALATVLCGGTTADGNTYTGYLKDYEVQIRQACAWAEQATMNKFLSDVNDQDSTDASAGTEGKKAGQLSGSDGKKVGNADGTASNDLDFVYEEKETTEGNWWSGKQTTKAFQSHIEIDQDQIANTFLNYFDLYCEQHFSPNVSGDKEATGNTVDTTAAKLGAKGNVVTDNTSYRGYTYYDETAKEDKHVGGTSGSGHNTINGVAVGEGQGLDPVGSYWLKMYNQMASCGIQFNSNLSNSDYLQQQMLYGNVSMKQFGGYSSASHMSINDNNSPMFLQDDEDAMAEETRRYDVESDAIAYKETLLDSMLQDLESEREAITTEKDSVQKIIDNNIKKFKLFC